MATRTISNAGGNWSAVGAWVEGAVPTSADDVVATATSGNLTITTGAVCRSLDLTGYTAVLTHNVATLTVGDGSGGKLVLVPGMTYTPSSSARAIVFASTSNNGGVGWDIYCGGKTLGNVTFDGVGGRWKLRDTLRVRSDSTLRVNNGVLDGNGQTVTAGKWQANNGTAGGLLLGGGAWTINGTTGQVWSGAVNALFTYSAGGGTVTFACGAGGSVSMGFVGGADYGDLNLAVAGDSGTYALGAGILTTGTLTLNGPSTVTLGNGGGGVRFIGRLILNGSAGNLVTLTSATSGTLAAAALTSAAPSTAAYAALRDLTFNSAGSLDARAAGNVNNGNNHNVVFAQPKRALLLGVG